MTMTLTMMRALISMMAGALLQTPAFSIAAGTPPPPLLLGAPVPRNGSRLPQASSGVSPEVSALLREIKAADRDALSVSEEDGRFLRIMVVASGARNALEIGGASGYSAIWIGLALRQTGGHLTSIEYDAGRARAAVENIRRAGLADVVAVVNGDAFKEIPRLQGKVDFVFLDAWKRDYLRFFQLVLPRLTAGGLFLAHNVVNKESEMRDFLSAIQTNPSILTSIVRPGSEGMSVSLKLK
jgi:caffeoyl-CoA O-methyltransferase